MFASDQAEITPSNTPGRNMVTLEKRLRDVCDQYRIDLAYSFGSMALDVWNYLSGLGKLDENTTSDVDIGVKASPGRGTLSVREKVELAADLENLLGVRRVDLVILSEADPFLSANVVRGERIFCRDLYLADEYELYILRRAGDLAPLELERLDMIFTSSG
jgi:predicted nucleotidyltransferase